MTRKDELIQRADLLSRRVGGGHGGKSIILEALQQVEREVWGKVIAGYLRYKESLVPKPGCEKFPTVLLMTFDEWCQDQQKAWMMTRDEFENKLELILDSDTGADCTVVFDELIAHDGEQRAVIEQQAKEIARLKGELDHWSYIRFNQLEQENKTLREALQLLYDTQNGCPLPKYEEDWNRAMELAAQVLKEVS